MSGERPLITRRAVAEYQEGLDARLRSICCSWPRGFYCWVAVWEGC
jgi:hypothetical protein